MLSIKTVWLKKSEYLRNSKQKELYEKKYIKVMQNKQKSLKYCMTNLRTENTILGMELNTKQFHYKKVPTWKVL